MQAHPRLWSQPPYGYGWRCTRLRRARTGRWMRTEQAQRTQRVVVLHALREIGAKVLLMVMGSGKRLRDQHSQCQRQNSAAPQQPELAIAPLKHFRGNLSQPNSRCNLWWPETRKLRQR